MGTIKDKVTVKYRLRRETCRSCGQGLREIKPSDIREYDFYLQDMKEYAPWERLDESELGGAVEEYVYGAIGNHAAAQGVRIILNAREIERVSNYIKEKLR